MAGRIRPVSLTGKLTAFGHDIMPVTITGILNYCTGEIYTGTTEGGELINAWVSTGKVLGNANMRLEVEA